MALSPLLAQVLSEVGMELGKLLLKKLPDFARRKPKDAPAEPIAQQITDLQAAARENAESVRTLAEELRKTVAALERSAAELDARLRRAYVATAISGAVAIVALVVAVGTMLRGY